MQPGVCARIITKGFILFVFKAIACPIFCRSQTAKKNRTTLFMVISDVKKPISVVVKIH